MSNCFICKKKIDYVQSRSCESNHSFHEKCITEDKFGYIRHCKDCETLFLKNAKWTKCSSCSKALPKRNQVCQNLNSLCPSCALEITDIPHLNFCTRCSTYLQKKIKQCDYCQDILPIKNLQKVPKCSDHSFCTNCLKRSLTPNHRFHKLCSGYFKAVNNKNLYSESCNLCGTAGIQNLSLCKAHKYCTACFIYIKENDCSNFINFASCEKCFKSPEIKKNKNRDEESKRENPEKPFSSQAPRDKSERNRGSRTLPGKSQGNTFEKCESGHRITELELKEGIFGDNANCPDCLKFLLMREDFSNCVVCKKVNMTPRDMRCTLYKNLCKDCYFPLAEITHVRKCDKCWHIALEKIKECNFCHMWNEKPLLYQVPKCPRHYFCKNCLKRDVDIVKERNFCNTCVGYFKTNTRKRYNPQQCYLCTEHSTKELHDCDLHKYCDKCFLFITSNKDCVELPRINQCKFCIKFVLNIGNVVAKEEVKSEIEKKGKNWNYPEKKICKLERHQHFLKEFEKETFDSSSFQNCKSCEELFLSDWTINFCIYCKSDETRSNSINKCAKYRNVCEKCFLGNVESGHVKRCGNCQRISRRFLKDCDKCHEIELESLLSRVPRCEKHYFCEECLWKGFRNEREFCEKCVSYFENIGKCHEMGCNLCALSPDRTFPSCRKHSYCLKCYEFITTQPFEKFPNVNNCEDCKISINALKLSSKDQFEVSQDDSPDTQAANINNPPSEICSKQLTGNEHMMDPSHYPPNPNLQFPQNINPFNSAYQRTDVVPQNHVNRGHENLNQILVSNPLQSSSAFPSISPGNSIPFDRQPNMPNEFSDSISLRARNNELNLSPICSNCRITEAYCAFLCNHNCCKECLVFQCAESIMNFFRAYSVDRSIAKNKFEYLCPVKTCRCPISVPTQMVLGGIKEMSNEFEGVKDKIKFSEISEDLKYLFYNDLNVWVPYFDGMKFSLVFKSV